MSAAPPPVAIDTVPLPPRCQVAAFQIERLEDGSRALTEHLDTMSVKVSEAMTHIEVADVRLMELTDKVGRMTHALWATSGSLLIFALTVIVGLTQVVR